MLARDVYPKLGWKPPIALHHEILPSLLKPGEGEEGRMDSKMSKSKPNTAVFIHDSTGLIKKKLAKAYCPPQIEGNPVLALARICCFRNGSMAVERPEKFGGDLEFASYAELEKEYLGNKLHAADLKSGVAVGLDALIAPMRKHFEEHPEFLQVYDNAEITR
jgi:tyrosyl-tRNA synthetase